MKKALITGISGQDGSYLAEFLLSQGYQVHGIIRRASTFNTERLDHIYEDPHEPGARLFLHYGDLADGTGLRRVLEAVHPDEVYNLGAQSHVKISFEQPEYTVDVTALGTLPTEYSRFHELFWPLEATVRHPGPRWGERLFLTAIADNKTAFVRHVPPSWWHRPYRLLRSNYKYWRGRLSRRFDPWFQFDLYDKRREIIKFFAERADFDLYGRGWERNKLPDGWEEALVRSCRGPKPYDDKVSTMSAYRFALAFENCVFPGYIAEKIFDCFLAGTIPIYGGAPDIEKYIPAAAFIDWRRFSGPAELDDYIRSLSNAEAEGYLKAARDWLDSADFARFTKEHFAKRLVDIFSSCLAEASR